MFYLVKHR